MQNINEIKFVKMKEKQITFSLKNHALDNNDNFSPDGKYLCYDTRATVFNENLANCKSIEKVEIETGIETVLWHPENITGENAAPGVAAVSFHPKENKVIFIHGPFLDEINQRGYYSIRNRNGVEVDGNGKGILTKVDLRDISNPETIHGAHRGGTHRHEYTRSGNRIGFTYDDFIMQNYERTIGYLEKNPNSPNEATHFFSVILKPAEIGKSKPGEIEKANDDSWVDSLGTMRAFIGKVRDDNGIDYSTDLFVADIPLDVDITTSFSGNKIEYPNPAKGISIRRLTKGLNASGIVRGSFDGKSIAFTSLDENNIKQLYIINADGSQIAPRKVSNCNSDVNNPRWHSNNNWIFFISRGNIFATNVDSKNNGLTIQFTNDNLERSQLVASNDGKLLAYVIPTETKDKKSNVIKDAVGRNFMQIFIMQINWDEINSQ